MEYFAYGSNMNPERMKQRIGWSPPSRGAVLQDYQLMFDKQSNDGGKANIRPLKGEAVEGVLYQLAEKDLLSLDGFEGVSTGDYAREKLEVSINGDGKCLATAYIALKTGPENPP
ncbi:MAG: gamma-glutamylcyclotransferase family protein, partial [SAR324 cluster bacterium]|nr:gamma-glutamylcyclotransferase family protein [SAR324 cluster bacterium]